MSKTAEEEKDEILARAMQSIKEVAESAIAREYKELLKKERTEYFKEHYLDAEDEEIEAYLTKFKEI